MAGNKIEHLHVKTRRVGIWKAVHGCAATALCLTLAEDGAYLVSQGFYCTKFF